MLDRGLAATRLPFRVSLQTKLVSVVLVCVVVPLFTLGAYLLRRNEALLRERAAQGLTHHLAEKDRALAAWFRERLQEVRRFSASFVVSEGIEELRGPDPERARRDLAAYLESLLGHNRVYESLSLVDPAGRLVASTREEVLEGWVAQALREARPDQEQIILPVRQSEGLGRPTLVILQAVQVPGPDRQEPRLGFLVARVDLRELEDLLVGGGSSLAPGIWLLDEQKRVVARAGALMAAPGKEGFPGEVSQEAMVAEGELPGVGPALYAVRGLVGPLPGYIAAVVPNELAYQSLRESQERLVWYGLLVVAVIVALNFVAARGVLRPIARLSAAAGRMAGGDLEIHLPVTGRDEIADLTHSFNDMAARIREGRANLEQAHDELARINQGLTAANRTLETLSITDGLTSLYNHRHFQETIHQEIQRGEELGLPMSLLLIDIDHFKQYNDRWGHTEGDAALRRVAVQIMKTIRTTDMAFRYGGEELAVLLPSLRRKEAAEAAEKVREAIRGATPREARSGAAVTVSIGVSTFPDDARVARALVDMADAALYAAKAQGRDRVVLASAATPLADGRTAES